MSEQAESKRSGVMVSIRVEYERDTATGGGLSVGADTVADVPFVYIYNSDPASALAAALDLLQKAAARVEQRMEDEDDKTFAALRNGADQ